MTISVQVPGSFAQRLRLRSEIRGLITRYGMLAWITLNPFDLRNPLVPILAGIKYSEDKVVQRKYYYYELTTFGMGN